MSFTIGERVATVEANQESSEAVLGRHLEECAKVRVETNERLRSLERVVWMAGGGAVLAQAVFGAAVIFAMKHYLGLN